jgi:hypothetical protein
MDASPRALVVFPDPSRRPQHLLSAVDVLRGIGGADAGNGHPGGGGQVGKPVRAGTGQLARIGQEDADIAVGLVPAVAGLLEGGQHRIAVPGDLRDADVAERER